jgi:hypothetical protein
MTIINAYKIELQGIAQDGNEPQKFWNSKCKSGGFNPVTQALTPFKKTSKFELHVMLDSITAAAEAGIIDDEKWVSQIFSSNQDFQDFLSDMTEYDSCYRIHDRWYVALRALAQVHDEEGFVTSAEIAEYLATNAAETGQI